MPNRLANESSPYLLQHKDNPVAWYPWGPEAIEKARQEQKPIFLSIGYSACHWCHVMEHESFEDDRIAEQLNRDFVPIKVDREERPDLDQIYMTSVQAMTGHGGWPMSVFLTPDLQPFYGGTYWPREPRMGMPGFGQILAGIAELWANEREKAVEAGQRLTDQLQRLGALGDGQGELSEDLLHHAAAALERVFDFQHGGFGGAPKFPHSMDLQVLLRMWRRDPREGLLEMVTKTLDRMAAGGIYDHLGGGFHRYSVDARWLVPHFEKMLYDNTLLAVCYLEGYQATGREDYARVVRETLDYVLREMTDPAGGIWSTQDADSEGVEGKYYVWTLDEVRQVLGGELAERFAYVYDVSQEGNFEGKSILNLPHPIETCAKIKGWDPETLKKQLAEARAKLLEARSRRVPPGLDDKVLVSWNALAIDALARAYGALGERRYLQAATRAAEFLLAELRRDDGRLLHSWRQGRARFDAYLDDYTYLIHALVSLYEAGFEERWIAEAVRLGETVLEHFSDAERGGFFYTADDHEQLIARNKDVQDSSVPSGNSMAALGLLRLGKLTGRQEFLAAAEGTLKAFADVMQESPAAVGQMLLALDMYLGPTPELVLTGPAEEEISDLNERFVPNKVLAWRTTELSPGETDPLKPLFAAKDFTDEPRLYKCQNFACAAPVTGSAPIRATWNDLAAATTSE